MSSMPVAGLRPGHPDHAADLVVRNAKVYTGDPLRPRASAVAIRAGLITAVGNDADVIPRIGPGTRVVDALGRRAVPGLNDSHLHVIRGGLNYVLELRWDGVPTLRQALAMLRSQAERTPPGQWVRVVGGWSADQFAERRLPTLAELNAAAPDTPVFVLHLYQSALMNRAALRAAGFDRNTPDPAGGQIVRGHDGRPTGMLLAAPGALLLYSTLAKAPTLDEAEKAASTRHFLRELNRFGLTSAIDAAGGFQSFPENYGTVMQLAQQGELTLRIAYHLFPQTAGQELDDLARWVATVRPGDGDAWLRLNGAGENLTWAAADFENFTEPRPELGPYEAGFEQAVRLLMEHGWGFRLHASYDETIRRDLAVFEKLAAEGLFPDGNRWLFDHAETVSPRAWTGSPRSAAPSRCRTGCPSRARRSCAATAPRRRPRRRRCGRCWNAGSRSARAPTRLGSPPTTRGWRCTGWSPGAPSADARCDRRPAGSAARRRWSSTPWAAPASPASRTSRAVCGSAVTPTSQCSAPTT